MREAAADWIALIRQSAHSDVHVRICVLADWFKRAFGLSTFSPGEIDRKFSENAKKALRAYADAQQASASAEAQITQDIWQKLSIDNQPVLSVHHRGRKRCVAPFFQSCQQTWKI
jgi:hypothetical protein